MNYEIIFILTAIMLFSYWFNYVLGGPLADDIHRVDPKAILFSFPNYLAIRRLKHLKVYREMTRQLSDELAMTKDEVTKQRLRQDKKRDIYVAGREFFTWERSLLCPICLHWWLSVIAGIILIWSGVAQTGVDYFTGFLAYLVNHLLIRKIS